MERQSGERGGTELIVESEEKLKEFLSEFGSSRDEINDSENKC